MAHKSHIADLFVELDGRMSFENFMSEALYHPRFGYYSSNIVTVGRRGDFSTSATISDTLGKAVGKWALQERKKTLGSGFGNRWHVIEIGAGDGSLARDFIANLPLVHRVSLTYHIVDTSAPLRKTQRENLPKLKARWHDSVKDALESCDGRAIIFSNELVDAFPATIVRWNSSRRVWEELILRDRGNDGMLEDYEPLSDEKTAHGSSVMEEWNSENVPLKDGQRCEIHWSYRNWQAEWLPHLKTGSVLTIDYGAPFPQIYHKRAAGTVRGYFQGVRLEGAEVYDRFGHQDLTADVNFTDLERWGTAMGLENVGLSSQGAFLRQMLPNLDSQLKQMDPALEFLLSPYGAGKAFQVLQQRRQS